MQTCSESNLVQHCPMMCIIISSPFFHKLWRNNFFCNNTSFGMTLDHYITAKWARFTMKLGHYITAKAGTDMAPWPLHKCNLKNWYETRESLGRFGSWWQIWKEGKKLHEWMYWHGHWPNNTKTHFHERWVWYIRCVLDCNIYLSYFKII